jgi:predicted acylesterase/phospholipase RssA
MTSGKRVGIVLSSGGETGVYAHTGFLMALERMGINVAALSGCSAGALVGGVFASGTPLQVWADALANIQQKAFWRPDPWRQIVWNLAVRKGRGYTGIADTDAAIDYIHSQLTAKTFDDCKIPFYALATNISRSHRTLFSEGELAPRIMASAAIPVFYRPVEIDGEYYSDGAVIEMTPTEAICCKHDLDVLVIHYTALRHQGPAGMQDAMQQSWTMVEIIQRLLHRSRPWYLKGEPGVQFHCPCGCGTPILVVEPDLPVITGPLHKDGPLVQQAALEQAVQTLSGHRDLLLGNHRA